MTRDAHPAPPPAAWGSPHATAPLPRRLAALAYEQLLLAGIVLVAGFATMPFVTPASAGATLAAPSPAGRALSAGTVFVVAGIYFAWSWSGGRRTLPMKTWRLALTRADGGPVDAGTAAARYAAAWIGPLAALAAYGALEPAGLGAHAVWLVGLNYLWALVDPQRQFLHDRIAGTRIVMRW